MITGTLLQILEFRNYGRHELCPTLRGQPHGPWLKGSPTRESPRFRRVLFFDGLQDQGHGGGVAFQRVRRGKVKVYENKTRSMQLKPNNLPMLCGSYSADTLNKAVPNKTANTAGFRRGEQGEAGDRLAEVAEALAFLDSEKVARRAKAVVQEVGTT